MKKAGMLCLMVMLLLSACGEEKEVSLDVQQLATQLASQLEYDDRLTMLSEEMSGHLYAYTDEYVTESKVYVSTGATTEEIAVFQCVNAENAEKMEDKALERVEALKVSVRNYQPKELRRLEKALVQRYGRYVIVSISNEPEQAEEIIQENIKNMKDKVMES